MALFTFRKVFIYILIIYSILSQASGQSLNFSNFSVPDGLLHSNVNSLFQDEDGFIFVSTKAGLCKYDGNKFHPIHVGQTLVNKYTTSIVQNKKREYYVGTISGVVKYDGKEAKVIEDFWKIESSMSKKIKDIIIANDQTVWAGSFNGLFRIDSLGQVKGYYFGEDKMQNQCISLLQISKDTLLVGTSGGLASFEIKTGKYTFLSFPEQNVSEKPIIQSLVKSVNGIIWVGTSQGLYYYESGKINKYNSDFERITEKYIWCLYENKNGDLYIGTDEGVYVMNQKGFECINSLNGLASDNVRSLLIDREGNLWIGTMTSGISVLKETIFKNYSTTLNINNNIRSAAIQPDGSLICGNNNGDLLILKNNVLALIPVKGEKLSKAITMIVYNSIKDFYWIGTYGEGLFILKKGVLSRFNHSELDKGMFTSGIVDRQGRLVATTHGLGCVIVSNHELRLINTKNGYYDDFPRMVFMNDKGIIFISTYDGFLELDTNGHVASRKISDNSSDNDIHAITQLNGKMYFGTESGLFVLNNNSFVNVTKNNQNLSHILSLTTSNKYLVIGNNSGVHLYRTETGKSYSFGYDDGYIPIQVSSRSIVSTNDKNAVWIIHNTGISYFDYNKLNELKTSGNLLFTSIDLFNNPYLNIDSNYVALSSDKGLYFDYDQNHISISFVGLSYHNTNSTSYRYMLEGFDKEWQKSSQINNKVVYSNLPPGEYTFLLEATFGKYNTQVVERKLKIIIDKPFWERWWFYAIQLFVLVVLFALSLYLKTRRMFLKFSTMIMILLVLILTELLVLFLEGYFERYTVGIPFLKLMVNVLMALMFSPLEKLAAKFYNSL